MFQSKIIEICHEVSISEYMILFAALTCYIFALDKLVQKMSQFIVLL